MAEKRLSGMRVAILVENAFEQVEMTGPRGALDEAGAQTVLVSPNEEKVQGWNHDKPADEFPVDTPLSKADPEDFDALLLPGGVQNPDKLRLNKQAVQFVRAFYDSGKPIAAICHGPWMLVEANIVEGHRLTSWPSLQTDIRNAGGRWEDTEVVVDTGIITSRKPDDIPAFNRAVIEEFSKASKSVHA